MLFVACNKRGTCKIKCGVRFPHYHLGCKPCEHDNTAACVPVDENNKMSILPKLLEINCGNCANWNQIWRTLGTCTNPSLWHCGHALHESHAGCGGHKKKEIAP